MKSSKLKQHAPRLAAVAVALLMLFVLASLATYSQADPPTGRQNPIHNVGYVFGAYLAYGLYAAFSTAAYLLVAAVLAIALHFAIRGQFSLRYLAGVGLSAGTLFLTLALWTYDAGNDPHRVYRAGLAVVNGGGWVGAMLAHYIMAYIGAGIWPCVAAIFVATAAFLVGHQFSSKFMRIAGVLLLMVFVSAFLAALNEHNVVHWNPDTTLPEGKGGTLGLALTDLFLHNIGPFGTYLVLTVVLVVGLLLATDNLVWSLAVAGYQWVKELRAARGKRRGEAAAGKGRGGLTLARAGAATQETVSAAEVSKGRPRIRAGGKDAEGEAGEAADEGRKSGKSAAKELAREAGQDSDPSAAKESAKGSAKGKAATEETVSDKSAAGESAAVAPAARPPMKIRMPSDKAAARREEAEADEKEASQMRLVDSSEGPGDKVPAYTFPPLDILDPPEPFDISAEEDFIRENSQRLESTLRQFGVEAQVVGIDTGPVITQYEVSLGAGIKVGKVIGLSDDLAIGLKAPSVRIVAPLPGRGTIGVEVPNRKRKVVRLWESIEDGLPLAKKFNLPLFLGKDSAGNPLVRDLTAMPHLLIGGTTGSGKSVCLNSIIMSILYARSPRDVKFILVDPKMVEMTMFARIPHLMCPVVSDMSRVQSILEWLITKMEQRYSLLAEVGVKNIVGYNALSREQIIEKMKPNSPEEELRLTYHMPYIVLVVDELADLMMSAPKEVEASITRLAQKSRAVGIHLILATQRPSVDVVTGLIKSNHPCRLAFQVASRIDSRTILDSMGAEKLLGKGDMLLMQPGATKLMRAQCTYISDDEINKVVEHVCKDAEPEFNRELIQLKPKTDGQARGRAAQDDDVSFSERDDLYDTAVKIVLQNQRGSVSLLQRKLNIGYGRASRLIDFMSEDGVVGEYQGSQAREALITVDEWEARRGEGVGGYAGVVGDDEEDTANPDRMVDEEGNEIQDDELVENEK